MPKIAAYKAKLRAHAAKAAGSQSKGPSLVPEQRDDRAPKVSIAAEQRRELEPGDGGKPLPANRGLADLPDRGMLLSPKSVALIIFPEATKKQLPGKMKWVRKTMPHKLPLGHKTPRWYEADVRWWLEDKREADVATEEGDG